MLKHIEIGYADMAGHVSRGDGWCPADQELQDRSKNDLEMRMAARCCSVTPPSPKARAHERR